MSSRSYRDETGHCDCCSDESDSCVCYLLLCWEGEHLMHGEDDGMDRLIDWGCRLALQAAPPAFDCSVLKVLPIHLAKSIEHRFLEVASRCGSIEHTDEDVDELRYLLDECGECRKGIYADWVNASALDVGEDRRRTGGDMPGYGGIYDNIEVDDPAETRFRMAAILAPALTELDGCLAQVADRP